VQAHFGVHTDRLSRDRSSIRRSRHDERKRRREDGDKEVSETVIEHRETVDGEMVDAPSGQRPGKGQNALRTCDVCAGRCRSSASRSKHPALTMSRASTILLTSNIVKFLTKFSSGSGVKLLQGYMLRAS